MPLAGGPASPVARNARERGILTASEAIEAGRVIAAQPLGVQAAARAALAARLRKRGTTIGAAYVAHVDAVAGRPHDEAGASAWRAAIVAVANLVQDL